MKTIQGMTLFWGRQDALSNWFMRDFVVGGLTFNCNEQYMMWSKAVLCGDRAKAREILQIQDPKAQRDAGRAVSGYSDAIWFPQRERVMVEGTMAKFGQHADLEDVLLGTDETLLVEASPSDRIWGVGLGMDNPAILDKANWRGLNLLGRDLTITRAQLAARRRLRQTHPELFR